MSLLVQIAAEFVGKKNFKEADKAVKGLQSSVKKLAGAAGIGLSTAAVINFGKNAVKAFAENEKSAKRLAGVVRNLGLELETPLIEANLDSISKKYGYQGEVLREAFQKLITATGSLTKSQDLLNTSLSISAGSGVDLLTVNQDLANLYVGNTKGLKKYNLGLSNAQLKTLKFEDALALLNKQFKGAAADELTTYSGKMRVLGEAAGNAQETIGGGLVDALMILTGSTDMDGLAKAMQDFAESSADALRDWAKLQKAINSSVLGQATIKTIGDLLLGRNYGEIFGLTPYKGSTLNPDTPNVGRARRFFAGGQDSILEAKRNKERAAAEKEANRLAKERAALEKKAAIDAQKRAQAEKLAERLKKQAQIFDLEYIQIYAALQGKLTDEERARVKLQLAILDENVNAAEYLSKKLAESQGQTSMLATFLQNLPDAKNPFASWGEYLAQLELQAKKIASQSFGSGGGGGGAGAGGGTDQGNGGGSGGGGGSSMVTPKTYLDYLGLGEYNIGVSGRGDVYVTVNGSVLTNQELTEAIRQGLLSASLSGSPSSTGRIQGSFAL